MVKNYGKFVWGFIAATEFLKGHFAYEAISLVLRLLA
jgi:hypothetical protein